MRPREAEAAGPALALGALVGRCSPSPLVLFYVLFTPFWFGLRVARLARRVPRARQAPLGGVTARRRGNISADELRPRYVYDFDEPLTAGASCSAARGSGSRR